MREFLIETGLLSAIIEPLLMLVVPLIVGWFGRRWHQITGRQLDYEYAEALHKALENGVKIGWRKYGTRLTGEARDDAVTRYAANYAAQFNSGAVKRFKLPVHDLRELASAHLPPRF